MRLVKFETHVLVTTRNGDIGIVPLCTHHSLNTISNEVSGLKAKRHASGPHGDTITDTNGVEPERYQPSLSNSFFDSFGEFKEMHVTSVTLVPHGGDTHLRFGQVLFGETHA